MFETFKNLKISERAEEVMAAVSGADLTCRSRNYTAASGVVTMAAHGLGEVICITVGDSAEEFEGEMIVDLEELIECRLEDAEIILHEEFDWPHPRMKGSTRFIQVEIFKGYV
ncbi:hypothetical protein ABZ616_36715 [Streptomyces noursei]|uniref:hypothetical protein n=1 Tax=Streptomyces noursei TaxID=1971 RepID=UPI0034112CFC